MAWRRTSDTPLSEPMMAKAGDAYMRHSASMSFNLSLKGIRFAQNLPGYFFIKSFDWRKYMYIRNNQWIAALWRYMTPWILFNIGLAWISNYKHYEMWDEITYPFPNLLKVGNG